MANGKGIPTGIAFADNLETLVKESEGLSDTVAALASEVRATLAIKTLSGEPIQHQRGTLTGDNFRAFAPDPEALDRGVARVRDLGLEVLRVGRFGVTVSGSAERIREATGADLVVQALPRPSGVRSTANFAVSHEPPQPSDLFLAPSATLSVPSESVDSADHFVFTPPPVYFAPVPTPPSVGYHKLDVGDIRRLLTVPDTYDGSGVKIGVVDTGFYDHPYYRHNNLDYRSVSTPSSPNADVDDYGHGTAITLNVFATAPGAEVLGFKQTNPAQDALEDAADAGVSVITCSWGYNYEQIFPILQATILDLISEGIVILFAAGNGHYAWPGSQPEVISIGGVYADPADQLEASNYASGFMSSAFPNRRVPDVCGLVGQQPKAIYITMPTQPGCQMDLKLGGLPFPDKDETELRDGWVGASGTSSATPQVAGIVALMLQKANASGQILDVARIRQILEQTAVPVTRGRNHMGFPAIGVPSTAVGWGLVNAEAALALV